jgi:hypothetical protein
MEGVIALGCALGLLGLDLWTLIAQQIQQAHDRDGHTAGAHGRGLPISGRINMQVKRLLVVPLLGVSVVIAAALQFQPLNVNTGLWQITQTMTWNSLPPPVAAMLRSMPQTRTYQSCVTAQDLNTNPWARGSGDGCTWTVLNSTGTDMEVQGTGCQLGSDYGMTAQIHGQIHILDPQDGTGQMTMTLSGNGQTATGQASYTGKWVGASCH